MGREVFDKFSNRSRLVVFATRLDAGRRGALTLDAVHLLDALVREDQGELVTKFAGATTSTGPLRPPERSFFSRKAAAEILAAIEEQLPPDANPVPDSADMACSSALSEIFARARTLAQELRHDEVEPLHLVAAMFSSEGTNVARILEKVGISKEAAIAAI
jgi:hypothetical protein